MAGTVPEPPKLFGGETKDAFYALLDEIRGADTLNELRLHWNRSVEAQQEIRAFFTQIEREVLGKMGQLTDDAVRGVTSLHADRHRE